MQQTHLLAGAANAEGVRRCPVDTVKLLPLTAQLGECQNARVQPDEGVPCGRADDAIRREVKNLLEIALIKRLASKAGFERVRVDKKGAELDFADKKYLDNPALFAEMERRKNTCRLDASKKLSVQIGFDGKNASANLHSLENFLLALS